MPKKIEKKPITQDAIGYCGAFCGGCPSFHIGNCHGCRSDIKEQKRVSKWKCRKRLCCIEKDIYSCGDCSEILHCKIRKGLVKNYNLRYNIDLDMNATNITEKGPKIWLENQIDKYKCSECGGIISPYDDTCFNCEP